MSFTNRNISVSSAIVIFSHIAVWVLLLQLVYDLTGLYESFVLLFGKGYPFIDEGLLIIPSLIALFYWNSNWLIPRYLNAKSWWKYLIGVTLSFVFLVMLGCFWFDFLLEMGYESDTEDPIGFFDFSLIQHLIVIGISTSLGISKIAMENDKQKKRALEKQRESELNYLKAQVSPHFLFNTLNTIYSLANEEEASQTSKAIIKLSENMRYMVREAAKEKVLLAEEIAFIQSYIDLQLLRLSGNAKIEFTIKGEAKKQEIAPLLLIPFVENVFKHGVSYQQSAPILIELVIEQDQLFLRTQNAIKQQQKTNATGAGIANTRKRLSFLYPDRYELRIEEIEGNHEVNLTIEL